MTDQDLTKQMVDKMDDWAKKIGERLIEKEFPHTPPAVAVLACIYAIKDLVKKSDVVTPAAAIKILENKLDEDEEATLVSKIQQSN